MQMENDMADAWDGGVQKLILYSYLFDWPHFFFIIRGRNESVQLFCCELPAGYYRAAREKGSPGKKGMFQGRQTKGSRSRRFCEKLVATLFLLCCWNTKNSWNIGAVEKLQPHFWLASHQE